MTPERIAMTPLQESYGLLRRNLSPESLPPDREMYELFCAEFETSRFEAALQELCRVHPMLLAAFSAAERCQWIAGGHEVPVRYYDFAGAYEDNLEQIAGLKQQVFYSAILGATALQAVHVVRLGDGSASILTVTDGIGMDGESQQIMIRDLGLLYQGRSVDTECDFNRFVEFMSDSRPPDEQDEAQLFWKEIIPQNAEGFSLPSLSEATDGPETRYISQPMAMNTWYRLVDRASALGVTPYALMFALYLRVLDRYSDRDSFLLTMPRSIRPYGLDGIENTVGMCADFFVFPWEPTSEPESLSNTARRIQDRLWDMQDHAAVAGPEVVRLLQERRGAQLELPWSFTAVLPDERDQETPCLTLRSVRVETGALDVETLVLAVNGEMQILSTYRPDKVDERLLGSIIRRYVSLLHSVCDEDGALDDLEIELSLPERMLIDRVNGTASEMDFPPLADLITESIRANWDEPAILADELELTYGEVWQRAAAMTAELASWKRETDDLRIGILMEKGPQQILAALASIFAGVAYMPIETTLPPEDIRWCIEHAHIRRLLTDDQLQEKAESVGIPVINCREWDVLYTGGATDPKKEDMLHWQPVALDDSDGAAIVINTSGTTGRPKSVLLGSDGLVNCLMHSPERLQLDQSVRWRAIGITNFCHDMSLFDYLGMFVLGGSVVLPDYRRVRDPKYLAALIRDKGVNCWNSVPALMEMMLMAESPEVPLALKCLKRVVLGGDWIRTGTVEKLFSLSPGVRIFSVGGPTETTIWNISHPIETKDICAGFIPYGKPFPNTKYHLLDARLRECPIGVQGPMFIEGIGVAIGYAGDPEETAGHFRTVAGKRMYESGDRGVYLPDGSIRFMGRADNQVKIHGKRIELGGIERRVNEIPEIDSSCCVIHGKSERIALFYVGEITLEDVRGQLESKLVDYMMPAHITKLKAMPLRYNGKPDRKSLASYPVAGTRTAIDPEAGPGRKEEEPDRLQGKVFALLAEVLRLDTVSPDDNYYFIGGDSVTAMQFISRLYRSMHVELEVYDILNTPVVADWIPLIRSRLGQADQAKDNDFILAICREYFRDDGIGNLTSLTEMGGLAQDAIELGERLGLTCFEMLSLPWPDHWRKLMDNAKSRNRERQFG